MTIELWDVDVEYELQTDCTLDGVNIVEIIPNSSIQERDDNYDIRLSVNDCRELARCLNFLANEIEKQ